MNNLNVKIHGNCISFILKEKETPDIKLIFNDREFDFYTIKQLYNNIGLCDKFHEFLPAVYYKETKRWNKSIYKQWKDKIKSAKNMKLKYTILYAVSLRIYEYQKVQYVIDIRNRRDKIQIIQQDNKEKNIIYSSMGVKEQNNIISEYKTHNYDTVVEYKYVDTSKIIFPSTLGSGAGKCIIWDIFETLGLISTFNPPYEIMSIREMFECSSTNEKLLSICENYRRCRGLLDKFRNNTYEINSSKNVWAYDDIELREYNGYFIPYEGKHRACIAKRFMVPQIYTKVHKTVNIRPRDKSENFTYFDWFNNYKMEELFDDCYKRFKKLGLNDEQAKYVLESGMCDSELIRYIESVTNKQLIEIAEDRE